MKEERKEGKGEEGKMIRRLEVRGGREREKMKGGKEIKEKKLKDMGS